MPKHYRFVLLTSGLTGLLLAGCTAAHYRSSADRETYGILRDKMTTALGQTNEFTIDTPYSQRDPRSIKSVEIIQERLESPRLKLSLDGALKTAVERSRNYQFRKESLYLAALTLTRDRYDFTPKLALSSTAERTRESSGQQTGQVKSRVSLAQLFKSGASLSVALANDLLRYYTGDPRRSASTAISANIVQPLLRGAGADIVAENLKQSERTVIYEVRAFSRFQNTFAVDIVGTYYRLLQQRDTVRNEYNNYRNLVLARERAEALSRDRLPAFQVDQARQDELSAKSRYILAVQSYQTRLDQFKNTLGLSAGADLGLDDTALTELNATGQLPVALTEEAGYQSAVENRLDVLNEIDRFEDSKRKIKVAANRLKADLNLFADASLDSLQPTDYARFNLNDYRVNAGVQLNLPLDRLRERNDYRAALIAFERQIRSLAVTLDDVRNNVRQGLRTLQQANQNYEIQKNAVELANRRVESATLLLQAGRAQIRDLLEAQSAQLQTRNAATAALVDYQVARLTLLADVGRLDTAADHFWLKSQPGERNPKAQPAPAADEVVPPEKLFAQ